MIDKPKKLYGVVLTHLPDPSMEKAKDARWHSDGAIMMEQRLATANLDEAQKRAKELSSFGHAIVVEIKFTHEEYLRGQLLAEVMPF